VKLRAIISRILRLPMPALVVFETNVVMDIWLGRRGDQAVLLVTLAERGRLDLVIPEFVLIEFQGTARRWVRDQRACLEQDVRANANEWVRSNKLSNAADDVRAGANRIHAALGELERSIEPLIGRLRAIANVVNHSADLHLRGDLRYLRGDPPDRPVDGLKDCRIYEAVLDIMRADAGALRPARVFLTSDADFQHPTIVNELAVLGAALRNDPGRLFGELLQA
jgi:PIN domain-containing protein